VENRGGDPDESRSPAARRRIEEWRQLHKALRDLSGGCGGVRPTVDAERTGVVIAATCVFADDSATVPATARPLIAGLARLLARHPERDHWIGVYAGAGTRDPWRLTTMRANALVAALASEGVAAAHLAAVGLGDVDERGDYRGPPHLAPGQALIEITVVAGDDELRRLSVSP
jgi:flagellar motor protein MotB